MSNPNKVTEKIDNNNSSEEDVDSDGSAMGELSSHSSIESYTNAEEDIATTTRESSITLDFLSLQDPSSSLSDDDVKCFWKMVQQSPHLYTGLIEFHRSHAKRHRRRLETPSAAAGMDQAEALRTQFTDIVVKQSGTLEHQQFWSKMSPELCDKFLCHIFLPAELGGLLGSDRDA
jgi:hypothetical protein